MKKISNNLTKTMVYLQNKDDDPPPPKFFCGVSGMRWWLSNYSKSLKKTLNVGRFGFWIRKQGRGREAKNTRKKGRECLP